VFPFIINDRRSRVYVNAGWAPLEYGDEATIAELNAIARDLPRNWAGVRYDAITFRGALEHLKAEKPRVLYLSLGETDDWAHAGRYELYLDAAAVADDQLRRLWETLQSIDTYRGKTTLVIATDHGRGDGPQGWKNHSVDIKGSNRMWMAVMGPDTPARGALKNVEATQSQVAATVAALLGEDFTTHDPRVAKALEVTE
jgi:arylsulfatase A-like enzyme